MKLLFDFFPIFLFFIAYKLLGIYAATAVAMAASLLQTVIARIKHKHFDPSHIITLIIILFLGGATLMLHNIIFIKWKPTAIYWIFATLFFATHFIDKPLIQRMMDNKLSLPNRVWQRLNLSWATFFLAMGFLNLYVVYHFSTNIWVDFKLFGALGLTIVFVLLQSLYMARHIERDSA